MSVSSSDSQLSSYCEDMENSEFELNLKAVNVEDQNYLLKYKKDKSFT